MKISYTGRHEAFPSKQRERLEAKLQKLSKMIDRKGEREAHVILTQERFQHKVEITINAWDHAMVGAGKDRDLVTSAHAALEKLEKQILKVRNKWRDTKRHKDKQADQPEAVETAPPAKAFPKSRTGAAKRGSKKVFRINNRDGNKPMTLDEAVLEMEASQDYMVYRDTQTDRVAVLVRRPDGHFDLIES